MARLVPWKAHAIRLRELCFHAQMCLKPIKDLRAASSLREALSPEASHELFFVCARHYSALKTILHALLTKDNATHTKDRRTSMQLTIDKILNDGFAALCYMLRASMP